MLLNRSRSLPRRIKNLKVKLMAKHDLILLAIDASDILNLMDRALHAAGYEVATVHDRQGLDKALQESVPALVILGEKFAKLDGISVSGELLDRFPTLPILLYANQDKPTLAKTALNMGLSNYIFPPLTMEDIVSYVREALTRASHLGDWLRREVKRTTSSLAEKAKISESERSKLEGIIGNIQDGVIVMDDSKNILLVNQAVREMFDLPEEDMTGKKIEDVVLNVDLKALLSRSSEGPLKYHEINFDDGRVFNAQYTPIPKIGAAITMQDISYIKELDRLAKKKNINLDIAITEGLKPLRANPIRVRQMLDNLVGNAIKYTPDHGKISIAMSMHENQIILKVEDTGPGIPHEEQSHVFEKFYRATNAPEGVQGTGLGLAIVKSIVDSHQGRVWVESTMGKGSSFFVLLPVLD